MAVGLGHDQSTSSETTVISPDQSQNVADQGIAISNRGNAGRITYRLGRGAVFQSGVSADQLNSSIAAAIAASQSTRGAGTRGEDNTGFSLSDLLTNRFSLNNDAASAEVAASNPLTMNKYLMWGVAVIAVIALVSIFKKKK